MAGSIPAGSTMKNASLYVFYLLICPMGTLLMAAPDSWCTSFVGRWIFWIVLMLSVIAYADFMHREKCEEEHPEALCPPVKPQERLHLISRSKFILVQDESGEFWILPGTDDDTATYRDGPRTTFALRGTVRWTWLSEADAEGVCREARKFINTRPWEPRQ